MGKDTYKPRIVNSWGELKSLVNYCISTGYASTDFETTGTNAMYPNSKPTILGVSFQPGSSWIIPLAHHESPFKNSWRKVLRYFGREVISNPHIVKIGQNIKFEENWWRKYGIDMVGRVFDTMLAKYLLDEERPHDLKSMVDRFIPEFSGYNLTGVPSSKAEVDKKINFWSNVPLKELSTYCGLDADLTFRLFIFFEPRLIDAGLYPLYRNLLMMASRVLAKVEYNGMLIDTEYLKNLDESYLSRINDCEYKLRNIPQILNYEKQKEKEVKKSLINNIKKEIEDLRKSGASDRVIKNREQKLSMYYLGNFSTKKDSALLSPLNFGSPKQMIDLLFESKHGFGFDVFKMTDSDNPSTDEETLLELQSEDDSGFITNLLELRGLSKIHSTYVKGILEKVNSRNKIHGSFLIHGTVTGRLSSKEPNLQNIPRTATSSDIKGMFISPPGKLMMQVDYSQAELRVLAFVSREKTMMEWFQTGKDIHLASACKKWDVEYNDILPIYKDENNHEHKKWVIRRKQAKTINFGIVYGQTAKKLSQSLTTDDHKVSQEEAQEFLDDFNKQFPKIARFIKTQHKLAKQHGYVKNLFGRKRRLPKVYSNNRGEELEALRQSVNAPIQGSASDFALFSSVIIDEFIFNGKLPNSLTQVGTVHDSLIYYVNPNEIHKIVPVIRCICNNPETMEWFNFEVEGLVMEVDFEVGLNWGDLKRYDPKADYTKLLNNTIK